jgi:thymidylate synthase (FAD)
VEVKIIEQPKVYLMGAMADIHNHHCDASYKEFEDDNATTYSWRTDEEQGNEWGEELVEYAGRLCYMSFDKRRPGGNKAYIDHIKEVGHGSVLEHAVYSFIITGVSRSLTHELIRHRAGWAYSELSQRYVDLSDVAFVIPPALVGNEELTRHFTNGCLESMLSYRAIVDEMTTQFPNMPRKEIRQSARSVLPNCTETKIAATANARALRHFFELRGSVHADAEIARLAVVMCRMMKEYAPNIFGDYDILCQDGREVIETKYRKV